jgi:hypothetical protein
MPVGEWDVLFEGLDLSKESAVDWLENLGFNPGAPADVLIRLFDHHVNHRYLWRTDLPPGVLDAAVEYPSKFVFGPAAEYGRLNDAQWDRLLANLARTRLHDAMVELREELARQRAEDAAPSRRGPDRPPFRDAKPPSTPTEIAWFAASVPEIEADAHVYALWWIQELHDDPEAMRQLAQFPNRWIRRSVARAQHLPPDVIDLLARDEDRVIQLFLSESCDDTPAAVLLSVWSWWDGSFSFPGRPRNHPNFPREGLLGLAEDPRPRVRMLALEDPASTADLAEQFSRDPAEAARTKAADDPRLSPQSAARLAEDESPRVRRAAYQNPSLPVPLLVSVLRDERLAPEGARNAGIPHPVMHRMIDAAGALVQPFKPYPDFG